MSVMQQVLLAAGGVLFSQVATKSYTGALQNWTVPPGVYRIRIKVWGAGGGSGFLAVAGATGAFSQAEYIVTPGDVLNIVVGRGGQYGISAPYGGGGPSQDVGCASGGGMSRVYKAGIEIVAGGGGGSGDGNTGYTQGIPGRAGGANSVGAAGGDSNFGIGINSGGGGGTLLAGGAAGEADTGAVIGATAGASFQGGSGDSYIGGGGGGGGGYFGGGGGGGPGAVGGGGSGYADGLAVVGYNNNNNGDIDYPGSVGGGAAPNAQNGQNGFVAIRY